jgi:hypothetical protein
MKHILTSAVIALFVTTGAFAHGGNTDTNEQMDSTMSMIPMPIRIGLDGSIAWGYMLKPMGHMGGHMGGMSGGMSGGMNGDMGHGDGGMNNGGMNGNGGHMNGGMMDMPSWMFKVMPMLTLSGDYYSRIINLATPKNINENTIQIDDNSKGYLAVVNKNYVVGASGGLMAMPMGFSIPLFGLRASLGPYKGGHVFKAKHIENKEDFNTIKEMKVPLKVEDIKTWAVNDRMSYSTRGGVMFGAGAGMSIYVAAMSSYMAEGQFITSVSKVSETEVMANIRKVKVTMLSEKVGNVLADIKVGKMKSVDHGFNFIFDLANKEAADTYREFLKGSVLAAQLAVKNEIEGVEMVKISDSTTWMSSRQFSYGLPFLYNGVLTRGKMYTISKVHNGFTGGKMEAHMSMYRKSHDTNGALSDHKSAGFIFMSMANTPKKKFRPAFAGSFKWYFQKDNTSNAFFHRQVRKLVKTFGLDGVNKVKLPTLANMGFVRAEVDLFLTKEDVKALLTSSEKADLYHSMYSNAYDRMNNYFSNSANTRAYCGAVVKFMTCKKRAYKKTWSALSAIPSVLKAMKKAMAEQNLEIFSKNFGKLGQLALTNRFVLEEIFTTAGKTVPKAVLKVKGSRVLNTKVQL